MDAGLVRRLSGRDGDRSYRSWVGLVPSGSGGSWLRNAGYCRASFRAFFSPGIRGHSLGFRLLRTE